MRLSNAPATVVLSEKLETNSIARRGKSRLGSNFCAMQRPRRKPELPRPYHFGPRRLKIDQMRIEVGIHVFVPLWESDQMLKLLQ